MAFSTSSPFSRRNRLVASAEIDSKRDHEQSAVGKCDSRKRRQRLTQNAIVLEDLGDVHAHLLDVQLQVERVHMHMGAGFAFLVRDGALQVGRYSVCANN